VNLGINDRQDSSLLVGRLACFVNHHHSRPATILTANAKGAVKSIYQSFRQPAALFAAASRSTIATIV
jgi:hypothetical protein